MSIDNLRIRLQHQGGEAQIDRMNKDKLKSLKKALLYSYQAATAILSDGREFRCLINPNRINLDLDSKILSIPFKGKRVNTEILNLKENNFYQENWEDEEELVSMLTLSDSDEEKLEEQFEGVKNDKIVFNDSTLKEEDIEIKEGDIICWKENGTHWLVLLRRLEETAYFRADIRRCRYELTLGNGSKYWAYIRGPVEQSILWSQVSNNYFNKLNYSLVMCITQNEETLKYFHRFKKVIINNQPWEVQVVDSVSTPGILEISLKETYSNTIKDNIQKAVEEATKQEAIEEKTGIYICGAENIYPYEVHKYELKNYNGGGRWIIENESRKKLVKIQNSNTNFIEIFVMTGKSGSFTLSYIEGDFKVASMDINIGSL